MTESQRTHFYFPLWSAVAKCCDWKMEGGRLLADLNVQLRTVATWPDHAREAVAGIITKAQALALQQSRAVTADDLRHACNWVASAGRTTSATKFTRQHLNQFDRLVAVLRDPWDLNATMAWLNPAEDDRKRTVEYLRKLANEARLIAISQNAWGTADWESLDQARLDALQAEVKKSAWARYPRRSPAAKANQPF